MPPRISLLIHTASADDFLRVQGISSYFYSLLCNLYCQTFQDFELVYTDAFYEENRKQFAEAIGQYPRQIKHVPLHPEHRYWYDKGYCYISAAKNNGILHADGELCITCDDAEYFPVKALERYWHNYKERGRYMHALHKRMRTIEVEDCVPTSPLTGDFYVNDHRWKMLTDRSIPDMQHRHGTWCFAGTSFSMEDALHLNGFNERMDGTKGLEDCDFGTRLRYWGRSFAIDQEGWLAIVDHPNYSDAIQTTFEDGQRNTLPSRPRSKIDNLIAVENYGICMWATELSEARANCQPISDDHLRLVQRETLKYRQFDPLAPENAEKLALWRETPTFDLRAQRVALRQSSDWKW